MTRRPMTRRAFVRAIGLGAVATGAVGVVAGGHGSAQDQGPVTPSAQGPAIPPELQQLDGNWPAIQGDLAAHRVAAGSPITTGNLDKLAVAWELPLNVSSPYGAITAPPIVVGDAVYFQDMQSNVYKVDKASGQLIWAKLYNATSYGPNGIAIGYGMIYGSTGVNSELFALDAASGKEIWRVKLTPSPNEHILMAPTVYDNMVYISTTPSYVGGAKGILFAVDAKTGAPLWQWDTTTDNLWGKARVNAGGGIWYPLSVDDKGNLYFGTGNPAPFPADNAASRPGPNLYTSSMVSLDPKDGSLRWYVQAAPHDVLDHDFQQTPVIVTVPIDGKPTTLAIGAGKTGTVIAADATTGKTVWNIKVGDHNDYGDGAPLPATPVTVLPGTYGGVESPMAYADGILFVPVLNLPSKFSATSWAVPAALEDATGELLAIDVVDGSVKWSAKLETFVDGAATIAGNVVFTGGLDGILHGYDVADGKEVWNYQAPAGLNSPLAIAGDMVFVPVGSPLYTKDANKPKPAFALIALKLGASGQTTKLPAVPAATPAATPGATPAAATPAVAGTAAASGAGASETIAMVDINFEPKALTIPANTPVKVNLPNQGSLPHNFSVDELKISVDADPGATKSVVINAKAGTYQYYCDVPGHKEAGMVGTLTVK